MGARWRQRMTNLVFGGGLLAVTLGAGQVSAKEPEVTWADVTAARGELPLWRAITGYALTCKSAELAAALERSFVWPEARARIAEQVLMQAWVERDAEATISYRNAHKVTLGWRTHEGFYRVLTKVNEQRALALLQTEEPTERRNNCEMMVVDTVAETDPARALVIACGPMIQYRVTVLRTLNGWFDRDPRQALIAAGKIEDEKLRLEGRNMIFSRWFCANPRVALAWAKEAIADKEEWMRLIAQNAGGLGFTDIDALERLADEEKDDGVKKVLVGAMERAWIWQPPKRLWTRIHNSGWTGMPEGIVLQLLNYAGKQPPAEALAFFKSVPTARLKEGYEAGRLAQAWARLDSAEALEWALKLPEGKVRGEALLGVNRMLVESDPKMAAAQVEAMPTGEWRERMMGATVRGYGRKNLSEAVAWVGGLPDGAEQQGALKQLAMLGTDYDPQAMAKAAAELPDGKTKLFLCEQFAGEWLTRDVPAAADWFFSLPDGPERNRLRDGVFSVMVERTPGAAIRRVETMADSPERLALIRGLAKGGMGQQPEAVFAVIDSLPEGKVRAEIWRDAVEVLTKTDPQKAAELAVRSAVGTQDAGHIINNVALEWSRSAPEDAARWLDSLGVNPGTGKEFNYERQNVAALWGKVDPEKAIAWANRLPEGETKSGAFRSMAGQISQYYPVQAFEMAVTNQESERVLGIRARYLFGNAPEDAEKIIRQSGLSDELKATLLEGRTP